MSLKHGTRGSVVSENLNTFRKSLLPSVSRMALTTLFAISLRSPVIDPELSTRMTTSFGLVAESMYHELVRKSCSSCPLLAHESSGGHFIAVTVSSRACGKGRNRCEHNCTSRSGRDQTVRFVYVTRLRVEGKRTHVLRIPKTLDT